MESWRLIQETERLRTTWEGLSVDDTLPLAIERFGSPPILHLYKFVPSAIVGRYQDIYAALKIERCKGLNIEINRRSTGGGTVIMGPEVLALGFGINVDHPRINSGSVEAIFRSVSRALIEGLKPFGIAAEFRPKNDIEVKGKKIAGLSAAMEGKKALLFHTSLLVSFDMGIFTEIMNTPLIKLQDKGYSCFSERLTTVSAESGRRVEVEEVMDAILKGFEETFSVSLSHSSLSEEERSIASRLEKERYKNPDWIFSHRHPRARMGIGRIKATGGLLEIYLSLLGAVIENIYITGDFFTITEDLNMLESSLKYVRCEENKVRDAIISVWKPNLIYGITPEDLTKAIIMAKENQLRL
ncbi:MAG: lipoate--protein ligase [Desulfatiglandales bacterium]